VTRYCPRRGTAFQRQGGDNQGVDGVLLAATMLREAAAKLGDCRNKISAILNGGGYKAGKVDGFRDKEFYTGSGLLIQEGIPYSCPGIVPPSILLII
jgi:hypothetical protein